MNTNNKYRNSTRKIGIIISLILLVSVFFLICCSKPKVYRVGVLSGLNFLAKTTDGFTERMTELGYIEGKNIIYDVQKTDFDIAVYNRILKKFIKDKVDLIFVFPTEAAIQAKAVTRGTGIPIVFANGFTEGTGLVNTIGEPGGNITGVRWSGPEITVKSFGITMELFPHVKRMWVLYQKDYPIVKSQLEALRPAASSAGITLIEIPAGDAKELEVELQKRTGPFGADVIQAIAETLIVTPDAHKIVGEFATEHNIPICGLPVFKGDYQSVFAFIPEIPPQGRQAANMADKIFKGTPAGKILVDTAPYLFYFNYRQAKKLGLEVGEGLLSQADVVIR